MFVLLVSNGYPVEIVFEVMDRSVSTEIGEETVGNALLVDFVVSALKDVVELTEAILLSALETKLWFSTTVDCFGNQVQLSDSCDELLAPKVDEDVAALGESCVVSLATVIDPVLLLLPATTGNRESINRKSPSQMLGSHVGILVCDSTGRYEKLSRLEQENPGITHSDSRLIAIFLLYSVIVFVYWSTFLSHKIKIV